MNGKAKFDIERNEALKRYALAKYAELAEVQTSPDANVEKVRKQLLNRSVVGLAKYGVTTERTDLSQRQWLQHALEEALDLAVYLQRCITDIDKGETP